MCCSRIAVIPLVFTIEESADIRQGLISRVTLLFTLQCQAAIVHRGPLHFTMVEVAENHHRIEAQDQNFRLVH